MKDFLQSPKLKWILSGFGCLVLLLLVFQLGIFVGYRKANFAFKWAGSYHKNFGGPKRGFMNDFEGRDFMNANGAAGEVIKIEGNKLTIKSQKDTEKIISVLGDAQIKKGVETLKLSDIKIGDKVVIIGSPSDDGTISAKLVRIFGLEENDKNKGMRQMMPFFNMPANR